jgi:hypothetical protein
MQADAATPNIANFQDFMFMILPGSSGSFAC